MRSILNNIGKQEATEDDKKKIIDFLNCDFINISIKKVKCSMFKTIMPELLLFLCVYLFIKDYFINGFVYIGLFLAIDLLFTMFYLGLIYLKKENLLKEVIITDNIIVSDEYTFNERIFESTDGSIYGLTPVYFLTNKNSKRQIRLDKNLNRLYFRKLYKGNGYRIYNVNNKHFFMI